MVCRLGLDSSYRKAAEDLQRVGQITLCYQTLRSVFEHEGQRVRQMQRQGSLGPGFTAEQCHGHTDGPTCLITGADGFHVPMITDAESRKRRDGVKLRRRTLSRRGHSLKRLPPRPRGADQKWKEAKLVTFYDPDGRHRFTAATTGDHHVLGRLMRHHGAQLHINKAELKYSVSDGADWIANQYRQQLPMLDARVLDYYHLREQTTRCASKVFGDGTDAARDWRKAFCTTLLESGPTEALTELGLMARTRRSHKRKAIESLHGYIAKRKEMTDYPRFLADGLQIGSGPTESQCKCLTARLKGRGRRWNRPGIDAQLAVRCLYDSSKQWKTYWPKTTVP